ncbi:MAG TPA: aldo/keto reductase [Egibacteraceae bacterium]|nr:aldo/keto reductase [Egibacteraceae bacterium]
MEFVSLGGHKVPALGLGTWLLEGAVCRRAVGEALDLGYRHIDTAQIYGNEAEVGQALAASGVDRDELFVTTKVWNDRRRADDVEQSVHDSLRKLGTGYVDLLLIHWPVALDRVGETLQAMVGLQQRELVRHIGVSNFSARHFEEAHATAPVVCNQVEYHPFLAQDAVLAAARQVDAVVTAYSPLARGTVPEDPTLIDIGRRHGKTPAQVTLRWLLDQDGVMAVPKASGRAHLHDNIDVFDFSLTNEERDRIAGLARGERHVDPPWAIWED